MNDQEAAKEEFIGEEFKVVDGAMYLGGYIGEGTEEWIEENIKGWRESVVHFAKIGTYVPQTTFTGLQRSLQH